MITFRTITQEDGTEINSMINPNAIVMVHERKVKDGETTYVLVLMDGSVITLTAEEFKPIGDSF